MDAFSEMSFEAAHRLPRVPEGHKCARLHGHSYRVELHVCAPLDEGTGMVMDFADIDSAFAPLRAQLDHRCLNDVMENPTSENLAVWIWERMSRSVPLSKVVVRETPTSGVEYRGPSKP